MCKIMEFNELFKSPFESDYEEADAFESYFGFPKNTMAIGDILKVEINHEDIPFVMTAINGHGEYVFISENIVGHSSIDDLKDFINRLSYAIDEEFIDMLSPCEHLYDGERCFCDGFKIWIPSICNIFGDYGAGKDDVQFEAALTCEWDDFDTGYYFTDTKCREHTNRFYSVGDDDLDEGNCECDYEDDIRICFSI